MSLVDEVKNNNYPIFFAKDNTIESYRLTLEQIHHLRVRRELKSGQKIYLSNDKSIFKGYIDIKNFKTVYFKSEAQEYLEPRKKLVTLLACPIKSDMYQLVVQKAVELGIDCITPLISEYTQGKDYLKKYPSLIKTIELACSQSRQIQRPYLENPVKLSEIDTCDIQYFLVSDWQTSNQNFPSKIHNSKIGLLVGPEGGWSCKDREILQHFQSICLSKNILRAETASILFCGMAMAYLEQQK